MDSKSQQAVRVGIRVTTDQAMSRGRLYRLVHAVNPTNVASHVHLSDLLLALTTFKGTRIEHTKSRYGLTQT